MAVREGKVVRNVAALVEPPPHDNKHARQAWTPEQAREFLKWLSGTGCTPHGE